VKQLKGVAFFDWMAERIEETISGHAHGLENDVLSMGLAWSFPIEYVLHDPGVAERN
jgi:hexokinase